MHSLIDLFRNSTHEEAEIWPDENGQLIETNSTPEYWGKEPRKTRVKLQIISSTITIVTGVATLLGSVVVAGCCAIIAGFIMVISCFLE